MNKVMIILTAALLINACKPADKEPGRITPEFQAYFNYMPGSYWVMKDKHTNETDSFYVSSYIDIPDYEYSSYGDRQQQVHFNIKQSSVDITWLCSIVPDRFYYQIDYGSAFFTYAVDLVVRYPFTLEHYNSPGLTDYYSTYIGNKTIETLTCDSVYQIALNTKSPHNDYHDTIYFNRDYGFLEMDLHNASQSHNWVLQRSNINR